MRQLLKDINKTVSKNFPDAATVLQILSRSANKRVSLASSLRSVALKSRLQIDQLAAIRRTYQQAKKARQVVDYDDLLALPVRLLKTGSGSIRRAVRPSYVMIDEYHDLNTLQSELIKLIGGFYD